MYIDGEFFIDDGEQKAKAPTKTYFNILLDHCTSHADLNKLNTILELLKEQKGKIDSFIYDKQKITNLAKELNIIKMKTTEEKLETAIQVLQELREKTISEESNFNNDLAILHLNKFIEQLKEEKAQSEHGTPKVLALPSQLRILIKRLENKNLIQRNELTLHTKIQLIELLNKAQCLIEKHLLTNSNTTTPQLNSILDKIDDIIFPEQENFHSLIPYDFTNYKDGDKLTKVLLNKDEFQNCPPTLYFSQNNIFKSLFFLFSALTLEKLFNHTHLLGFELKTTDPNNISEPAVLSYQTTKETQVYPDIIFNYKTQSLFAQKLLETIQQIKFQLLEINKGE